MPSLVGSTVAHKFFLEHWLCNKQFRSVEVAWFYSVAYVAKEQ